MATVNDGALVRPGLTGERWFHLGWMACAELTIVAGFAPTWFLRPLLVQPQMLPITPLVWLHGLLFTAWLLLFAVQVSLVSGGNLRLHRSLGRLALLFLVALPVVAILSALHGAARHAGPPFIPAANFLAVPLFSAIAIGPLIWLAYRHRTQAAFHKRYILMAMTLFIAPGSGRLLFLPGPTGLAVVPTLFALAVVVRDWRTSGRVHRATWIGGSIAMAALWGAVAAMQSPVWVHSAQALITWWN